MKNIILALLVGSTLVSAGSFETRDGAAIYKQKCSVCHGQRAEKMPEGATRPLAGMDATILALTIRAYRDQDKDIGSYTMHKDSQIMKDQTVSISDREIGSLAKYISGLQ